MTPLSEVFLEEARELPKDIVEISVIRSCKEGMCEECDGREDVEYSHGFVEICEIYLQKILKRVKKLMSEYMALKMQGKVCIYTECDRDDIDYEDDDDCDDDDYDDDDYDDDEDYYVSDDDYGKDQEGEE